MTAAGVFAANRFRKSAVTEHDRGDESWINVILINSTLALSQCNLFEN